MIFMNFIVIHADATGNAKVNIWGKHLGKIEEGCCYEMKGLMVRGFRGCICLSTSKENCNIEELSTNPDEKMQLEIKLIRDAHVLLTNLKATVAV